MSKNHKADDEKSQEQLVRAAKDAFHYDLELKSLAQPEKVDTEAALLNRILQVFVLSEGDEVFEQVLDIVLEETGSQHGIFGYISEPDHLICPSLSRMIDACEVAGKCVYYPRTKWKGMWSKALLDQRSFYANQPQPVPEGHPAIDNNLAAPVVFQGKTIGLLNLANKNSGYTEADLYQIDSMAECIAPLLYVWIQKKIREEERVRHEEALQESEKRLRRKLETVLSPEGDPGMLKLADLIDTARLQKLMEKFYAIARIPVSIIDINGKVLAGVGWQEICSDFHRIHPETCKNCIDSDIYLSSDIPKGEFRLYKCKNGMWDMSTPIIVERQHLGNILSGQFFFEGETIDRQFFRKQARKYGFKEDKYLEALDRVPRINRNTVTKGMSFFLTVADILSQLSFRNVKLARLLNERDRLTQSLRESRAKFEAALASMTDAVCITDTEGQYIDFNDAFATFHRFESKQECFKTFENYTEVLEAYLPDGKSESSDMWPVPRALRGEIVTNEEYVLQRKDTGEKWVGSYSFAPIRDKDGGVIGSVVVGRDVTEQKKSEEALKESEERLRLATEAANMYGWEFDLITRVLKPSDNAGKAMNFPVAKKISEVWKRIHPEDYPRIRKIIDQAVDECGEYKIEYRINPSPEKEYWVFTAGVTIAGTDGKPARVVGVTQNITERKKAEETLRLWNETLEQQVSERTELARARAKQLQALAAELVEIEERERKKIAHLLHDDLQQLLAGARLQLQSAGNSLPNASPVASVFLNVDAILEESIKKSRRLSHELSPPVLHQSGLIAGLNWLVRQMDKQFGLSVKLQTNLTHKIESSSIEIFIFRAVQELLFNTVKHGNINSAQVYLSAENGDIIAIVEDRGVGFNSTILESTSSTKGFGLMSLKERAQYFGGELKVESEPGNGSRFTLTVPASITEDDERKSVAHSNLCTLVENGNIQKAKIRVLIVDDHRVIRQGIAAIFKDQLDIKIVGEAGNGREALKQIHTLRPDVILMDISMPELDGVETTRLIKADWPLVRVIGLSMHEDEQITQTMQEAGAEVCMTKTASSSELLQAIYGNKYLQEKLSCE